MQNESVTKGRSAAFRASTGSMSNLISSSATWRWRARWGPRWPSTETRYELAGLLVAVVALAAITALAEPFGRQWGTGQDAYCYYQANKYTEAITAADRFITLHPGNKEAPYAYYLKAVSLYEQIVDVGRDQASTEQAQAALREVVRRYPQSEYAADARLKMDMVNDQLAGKEMTIGRYYLRQGDPIAAVGRFRTVVDKYQTTSHTPEALYRMVEAYLTVGLTGEATKNGAVLGYNYPGDTWYRDAYRLLTSRGLRPAVEPSSGPRLPRLLPRFRRSKEDTLSPPAAPAAGAEATTVTQGAEPPAQPTTKPKKKGGLAGALGL